MTIKEIAYAAYQDFLKSWWDGDARTGHITMVDHGFPGDRQDMLWDHAQAVFALDSLYCAYGDDEIRDRILGEWDFVQKNFTFERLVTPANQPNWAQDDAGWDAMLSMLFYRYSGDPCALKLAKRLIRNSYEFWKDEDVSNGLLYGHEPKVPEERGKAMHMPSLMLAAFDYTKASGDDSLLADTIHIYNWVEKYMLRGGAYTYTLPDGSEHTGFCDDNLYWFFYNAGRVGKPILAGPQLAVEPYSIEEGRSAIFLGGTMAMAVLHLRMYGITKEQQYRDRALRTLRAVNDSAYVVTRDGVYVDAGDGWTNSAFLKQWVEEVLTLQEAVQKDFAILENTARSIYENARTEDGYYSASWSGPAEDSDTPWGRRGWTHDTIMTTATSIHMITAAAFADTKNTPDKKPSSARPGRGRFAA